MNKLILGENLAVLRCLLEDYNLAGRVDLVYIDPPFSTNVEYRIGDDRANTVSMAHEDEVAYSDTLQVGKKAQDLWEFKDPQYPCYPTEKNLDLLKFIVEASSNPGDLVLDCFCGSGTTLVAAQQLGRKWIGVDRSERAIAVAERRLRALQGDLFTGAVDFEVLVQEGVTLPVNRLTSG